MAAQAFPVSDWTDPVRSLNTIKNSLLTIVSKEELWYRKFRSIHAFFTRALRFSAIALFGFGTIYPIWAKGQNLEWGYISLAVGSLILLMDKYFGISSSFVRFYKAEIDIINSTGSFVEDWEIEMVKAGPVMTKDTILNLLHVAKRFRESIAAIIATETVAWATEFNAQIGELQQELLKKEEAYKTGNLSVVVNNTQGYSGIELSLDKISHVQLNGDTSTVFRNISIAPHTVSFKGNKNNVKIEFSKNIDVVAEKTAELVLDLP